MLLGGSVEKCAATLTATSTRCAATLYRLTVTLSDTFWVRTCAAPERVAREIDKAAHSERADLRRAAAKATHGLATGDKTETYLALRDIDPPCAFMFNYTI